ncbi:tyrosine-type recombinase/integrase [Clostridium estertheticum]
MISSLAINKKIQTMQEALQGYWADDRWDIKLCPLKSADELRNKVLSNRWINFNVIKNPWIKVELKFFYYINMMNEIWKPKTVWIRKGTVINSLIEFLDREYPSIGSISEVPLEKAIIQYRTYLVDKGIKITTINKKLNLRQEMITIEADSYYITNFKQFIKFYEDYYFEGEEWDKDVWDRRKMNLTADKVNPTQYEYTITFKEIQNIYFKRLTKRFCRLQMNTMSFSHCKDYAQHNKVFFNFLSNKYPGIGKIKDINRSMVESYFSSLTIQGLSPHTFNGYKSSLSKLFETMQMFEWDDAPVKKLIFPEDYSKGIIKKPRFIDEYVLEQLNKVVHELPDYIARMTLILQECGMRISELCTLKIGCLIQDKDKDWFLQYYQWKMKKEHIIPISKEVAELIGIQEVVTTNRFNGKTEYLFPREDGSPLKQDTFRRELNKLAYSKNIVDRNGKVFRFQAHAFRHTVGTRMINNEVPQYIVQRFLGHESPEMTMRYAHIHDVTMKKEFIKFKEKFVNNQGFLIDEEDKEVDNADLQWFKKNINAQALPNGYCRLPVLSGACPHANACLDCTHFCTNKVFIKEHKNQLQKTKEVLEIAQNNNWVRQIETNIRVKERLEAIILTLVGDENHEQ